tara:strand:- start:329 stop:529 length:201 start_codon:yes stop_codon:yes gene_type:complete
MIITTTTIIIVQVIALTWIIVAEPEPCPNKYMTLEENGGELQNIGDTFMYCDLDSYGRFILKEKEE